MHPRWTAVAALSQALLAAVFVFHYVAGDSTSVVAAVGTVAALCASVSFGLEYRKRRRKKSAWNSTR
ncbi:hypothetical protein [Halogeometricum luteum]|uniref:PEP-CTERM protein-sorting domain-containing protein n=1 Tax=Halogeometricum luteum TaxID=2950537 RepID=A0ABU2FYZ7_9EURY|nr:hypothetical protein [Halogeometricum sp. S3BR5-2]MDS0293759.1 hypothetical protein [Halogeometricum sp. S3BR5-2]